MQEIVMLIFGGCILVIGFVVGNGLRNDEIRTLRAENENLINLVAQQRDMIVRLQK